MGRETAHFSFHLLYRWRDTYTFGYFRHSTLRRWGEPIAYPWIILSIANKFSLHQETTNACVFSLCLWIYPHQRVGGNVYSWFSEKLLECTLSVLPGGDV